MDMGSFDVALTVRREAEIFLDAFQKIGDRLPVARKYSFLNAAAASIVKGSLY